MTAPVKYVMRGQLPTPPYQEVTWSVFNAPDNTGAQSGYGAGVLINIFVDYTIVDNVVSGGNEQAAQVPPPPAVVTPKVTYVMKALCSQTQPPNQLVTWKSPTTPDYAGNLSGFAPASLSNVVIDYTINDSVTAGSSATASFVGLAGDATGIASDTEVVALVHRPLDLVTVPSAGQVLTWNGTEWTPNTGVDGPAGGDLTGNYPNPTIANLQGKPVSATTPSINQSLTWNGSAWVPASVATGPAGGDLSGNYPNPTVAKIQGNPVSGTAATAGQFLIENAGATGSAWTSLTHDIFASVTTPGQLTVVAIQGVGVASTAPTNNQVLLYNSGSGQWTPSAAPGATLGGDVTGPSATNTVIKLQNRNVSSVAPQDGYVLTWVAAHSDWEPLAITSGSTTLGGDVTGPSSSNTVVNLSGLSGTVTITANKLLWDKSIVAPEPTLTQAAATSGNGGVINILGQDSTTGNGGVLYLSTGFSQTSTNNYSGAAITLDSYVGLPHDQAFGVAGTGALGGQGIFMRHDGYITFTTYGIGLAHFNSAGNISSAPVNLAGGSLEVTGVLPIANQAFQTMAGDVTGTTAASTVAKLQGFSVSNSAPSTNNILTWNGSAWAPAANAALVTWTDDLSTSTNSAQWVSSISGASGGGGTVAANISTLAFNQTATISAPDVVGGVSPTTGGSLTIQAGANTGGTSTRTSGSINVNAGNISGGTGTTITVGNVNINAGSLAGIVPGALTAGSINITGGDASQSNGGAGGAVNITTPNQANNGTSGAILLQTGDGTTAGNASSGNITLRTGSKHGGGTVGSLIFQTNDANTRLSINGAGTINVPAFSSAGLVHNDSSGNLSSSLLVDADVATAAAIAVSKLGHGTADQLIDTNHAGNAVEWFTLGGDASFASHNLTVTGINGTSVPASPSTNTVLVATSSSTSAWQQIVDANVSNTAAIGGAKIVPDFGSQSINAGTFTLGISTSVNSLTGSLAFTTKTFSSTGTIDTTTTDCIIYADTSGGAFSLTLPAPTNGRFLIIKDKKQSFNTNNLTLVRHGTEKIDGVAASLVLNINNEELLVVSDGTDWYTQGSHGAVGVAGGDLSGSYPNPTVAKVNGVSYPATPSTNTVPVVTGSNTVTYQQITNSQIDPAAAIAYSKLNLTGDIVNSDISSSAAIVYSKLSLTNSIVNADINSAAAIAYSKLNLTGDIVNSDISSSAAIVYSKLSLTNSIVNADINSAAAIAYSKLNLTNSIVNADISTSAAIAYSKLNLTNSIVDADINSAAAIAGSKITPNFGTQTLTAGTSSLGTTTSANSIIGSITFTTKTFSSAGTIDTTTNDVLVYADTSTAGFTLTLPAPTNGRTLVIKDKKQSFASNNLTLARHGTEKIDGVAASLVLSTNNQEIIVTSDGTDWYTNVFSTSPTGSAGGDLSGTYPNPTVAKINGASVPAAGSLTTGNVLQVNGASSLTYGAVNLAGGSNYVTGTLPFSNIGTITLTGDTTGSSGTGTITTTTGKVNGVSYPATPSTNTVPVVTGSNTITYQQIVNAQVDPAAAIAYSKLNLTGSIVNADINASAAIAYSKLNLTGDIVNADISSSAAIAYSKLNLSGSIVNADINASAAIAVSKLAAGTAGQILQNNGTPTPTWTTVSGDVSISNTGVTTVLDINGASVPAAGSLTTGNVLQVSGASALTYAAINLAGGSNYVTGQLPPGNMGTITLTGDVTGSASGGSISTTVAAISGSTPIVITPAELQWKNSTSSPLIDQAALASTSGSSGSNGQNLTVQSQAGQAATGASHNGGNGGQLNLASGAGGTSGSASAGSPGGISIQPGGTELIRVHGGATSALGTISFTNTSVSPAYNQTALASTSSGSGSAGNNWSITAQAGQAATGASHNGGNGGELILSSGAGGTSGSATPGTAGTLLLQTGGTTGVTLSTTNLTVASGLTTTLSAFSLAGVVHNDSSGNLSSSLIVNADVSASAAIAYSKLNLTGSIVNADINSSAAVAVSKLAAGTAGQILMNNSTPTPTWTSVSGDITLGNTGTVTVTGLQSRAVASTAPSDGQVLTWSAAHSDWEPVTPGAGGVTWANDLAGSSSTHQYVVNLSGGGGGGNTVTYGLGDGTFGFAIEGNQPLTAVNAGIFEIFGNPGFGGSSGNNGFKGGDVLFQSGVGGDGSGTNKTGGNSGKTTIATSNGGAATGTSANSNSGDIDIKTGAAGTGGSGAAGTVGTINLKPGGTTQFSVSSSHVNIAAFSSAGVVHNDSSGNLTSSTIVDADVSSSAAIAVFKLAAGTAAQVLMNNGTPTPTWTSFSGDVTVGNTGTTTVAAISGSTPIVITPAELQWKNSTSSPLLDQAALASTSSASGSAGQNLSVTAQAGQAATGASHNGGAGGNLVLAGGAGGTSGSATAGASGYVQFNTGTVEPATTKTSDYTITYADFHIFANFSAGHNLTLPAPINGLTFHIWDIAGTAETNNITLVRNGSEKISGVAASRVLSTNWGHWMITTNGTDWFVG